MSKSLRLAYFLPSDVEAARNTIMGWLREHGHKQHRTLCLTQPAAFIDPSNLSGQARRACLRGVIPISIVVGKEKGTLVAAVVRPPQTRQEEGVLELLRRFRIPVFMGDLASEASLLEFLAASNPSYRFSPSFRKVTNMSEARLMRKVKSSLGILGEEEIRKLSEQWKRDLVRHYSDDSKKRFRVYEEVALPEIIDGRCDEFDDTLSAYRVDLLVASPPPQSKPLFVVEFDGPKHEDPRRREKDSVRDNVLLRHSLPVLRISYRNDLFQRDKSGVVDVVGHYFSVLINRVGEVVENEFVRKEEKLKRLYQKRWNILESLILEHRRKNAVLQITQSEFGDMMSEVDQQLIDESEEVHLDLHVDDMEDNRFWESRMSVNGARWLSGCLGVDGDLKIERRGSFESGLAIECSALDDRFFSQLSFGPFYGELKAPEMFHGKLSSLPMDAAVVTALELLDAECGEYLLSRE